MVTRGALVEIKIMTRLEDFLKLNKNRQIWTISKDQSVMQALILMSEKDIGAIIVVDNKEEIHNKDIIKLLNHYKYKIFKRCGSSTLFIK